MVLPNTNISAVLPPSFPDGIHHIQGNYLFSVENTLPAEKRFIFWYLVARAKVGKISGKARFSITFVKNRDMEENIKYFKEAPFDVRRLEVIDMEAINTALEQGTEYLRHQYSNILHVRDNCKMLLNWLIGGMMALAGTIMAALAADSPNVMLLTVSGYELLLASTIAASILYGAMYRRTIFLPGASPSYLISEDILKALDGFPDKTKYIKGWQLQEIQFRIMYNDSEQIHEVKVYRRALFLCIFAVVSGAIIAVGLSLFGL